MKRIGIVLVLIHLCLLVMASGVCADRSDDCVSYVNKCLDMFAKKGKDYTLNAMNESRVFCDKELYVFAISLDNVCVAHPYKPSLVGKDLSELKDADGKPFVQALTAKASEAGSGWVEYQWLRPGEETPRFKRTFVSAVPGTDLYVGAGYYPKAQ